MTAPRDAAMPPGLGVVVVAAGSSTRMEGVDKTFTPVRGLPLVAHCLDRFESFAPVGQIALVLAESFQELGRELVRSRGYRKVTSICPGGARRQDSVRAGLESLSPCRWVVIHDGARPCFDHTLLQRGLEAVEQSGAAVAGVPVKDTIKVTTSDGMVSDTPPRDSLWAAQTPQFFRYDLLLEAHRNCPQDVTDDAAMVEMLGHPVRMFLGSYENLKVTTPEDLTIMEALLRAPEDSSRTL